MCYAPWAGSTPASHTRDGLAGKSPPKITGSRKDGGRRGKTRILHRIKVFPPGRGMPGGPVRLRHPDSGPDGPKITKRKVVICQTQITQSGRTVEEITASVKFHMRSMVNSALEIGMDLTEMKEACRHGEWLPWLKTVGISSSTASNYMRIAREVSADSKMAGLPYGKVLALLALPPEERESVAEQADEMSAAEIRRLTEERNKAAEAANAETVRADRAEADAKRFYDENAQLRTVVSNREARIRELAKEHRAEMDEMKAKLLTAENNVVEVEKVPEDYERLKKEKQELLDAAAEAEERAAAAEAELEEVRAGGTGEADPAWKVLKVALTRFMADVEMLPLDPAALLAERSRVEANLTRLEAWTRQMRQALFSALPGEGAVV